MKDATDFGVDPREEGKSGAGSELYASRLLSLTDGRGDTHVEQRVGCCPLAPCCPEGWTLSAL